LNNLNRFIERYIKNVLFFCAAISIFVVLLITVFVCIEGFPIIKKHGLLNFMLGRKWYPLDGVFGIFPMIIGSIYVTCGALLFGVPLGVGCAIFLAEIVPQKIAKILRPGIELLAGIPSVVYGFYGMVVIVPLIKKYFGGSGFSVLAASVILTVMILPTIVNISEDAIRAVPDEYKEGSLALGATHWQTIKRVVLPTARSGIMTAIVLGMGRAIGETMAVILVTGNVAKIPGSFLDPVRTLTSNIAIEMPYSAGEHTQALFATGIVLFVLIMFLNILSTFTRSPRKGGKLSG